MAELREVLDDATDKWGVRVVRVEIQRIDPPPDIVSAMHAQMRAERDRRATVTEANGYQEAAIARADGEQQAAPPAPPEMAAAPTAAPADNGLLRRKNAGFGAAPKPTLRKQPVG